MYMDIYMYVLCKFLTMSWIAWIGEYVSIQTLVNPHWAPDKAK